MAPWLPATVGCRTYQHYVVLKQRLQSLAGNPKWPFILHIYLLTGKKKKNKKKKNIHTSAGLQTDRNFQNLEKKEVILRISNGCLVPLDLISKAEVWGEGGRCSEQGAHSPSRTKQLLPHPQTRGQAHTSTACGHLASLLEVPASIFTFPRSSSTARTGQPLLMAIECSAIINEQKAAA